MGGGAGRGPSLGRGLGEPGSRSLVRRRGAGALSRARGLRLEIVQWSLQTPSRGRRFETRPVMVRLPFSRPVVRPSSFEGEAVLTPPPRHIHHLAPAPTPQQPSGGGEIHHALARNRPTLSKAARPSPSLRGPL